jgi:uridine kinase
VEREAFVSELVERLLTAREGHAFWRVGVDGVDGAGKTCLAEELAGQVERRGVPAVRLTLDGFHNSRAHRYQRGRESPSGFFLDSYDYDRFRRVEAASTSQRSTTFEKSGRSAPRRYRQTRKRS